MGWWNSASPTTLVFLFSESCRQSGPWDLPLKQTSFLGEDSAGAATEYTARWPWTQKA